MSNQKYTLEEIDSHKEEKNCWVVIDNKVYDVSEYLEDHPGGSDVLFEYAGQDATEMFEDIGHSTSARKALEKLKIGECDEVYVQSRQEKKRVENAAENDMGNMFIMFLGVLLASLIGYMYSNDFQLF